MQSLHEAQFYERLPGNEVRCALCPHDCRIRDGGRGACVVRINGGGVLYTLVYDKVVSRQIRRSLPRRLEFAQTVQTYSFASLGWAKVFSCTR